MTTNKTYIYGGYPPLSSHNLRFKDEYVDEILDMIDALKSDVFCTNTVHNKCKKKGLQLSGQGIGAIINLMVSLGYYDVNSFTKLKRTYNGRQNIVKRNVTYRKNVKYKNSELNRIKRDIHRISDLFKYKKKYNYMRD